MTNIMRTVQFWQKFARIFLLHWRYHWSYHHPETSQSVQSMQKVECFRDKARFRIDGSDDILRELLVFSPKENGHDKDFLFLVDDSANTYTSIPKGWQLIDSDGVEARGDVVGFLDGRRYLFEGGSGKLIAVAEE
ncbi:MAG: hypothetical protein OXU36_09600 [Candidatus Poribacteria bacterium]|nr:hypothetical protein [Candidatus Poribacteria bacterium]